MAQLRTSSLRLSYVIIRSLDGVRFGYFDLECLTLYFVNVTNDVTFLGEGMSV